MTVASLLAPNISNYYNLALFICHLFVDGQFRTGHILYDSIQLDGRLIAEIDTNCPQSIPWVTTDISRDFVLPLNPNNRTDRILQLIFIDPNHLPENIHDLKHSFAYYNLYIIQSTNEADANNPIDAIRKLSAHIDYRSPILNFIPVNDSINLHWFLGSVSEQTDMFKLADVNSNSRNENVFNLIFGKYEKQRSLMIKSFYSTLCKGKKPDFIQTKYIYPTNYLSTTLNASFIIRDTKDCYDPNKTIRNTVQHIPQGFYKEMTIVYKPIEIKQQMNQPGVIRLHLNDFQTSEHNKLKVVFLHPNEWRDLLIVFFYGSDYDRSANRAIFSKLFMPTVWNYSSIVVLIAIICFIRRRFKLRRESIISCLIDIAVTVIGGGNLNILHKIERWFFGILLIAAISFNAIGINGILFPSFINPDRKISTYKELAEINPPIYITGFHRKKEAFINEPLRARLKETIHYAGTRSYLTLIYSNKKSFALVTDTHLLKYVESFARNKREFDVLKKTLVSIPLSWFVTSNDYLPERILEKVNEKIISLSENGLLDFYSSLSQLEFVLHHRSVRKDEDDVARPMTMNDLKSTFLILLSFLGISLITFILEILIYRFRIGHSRRRFI